MRTLLLPLVTFLALSTTALAQQVGPRLGLLVGNASALDAEEQAAYNFASNHGFVVTSIDPSMIANNPSILNNVNGFWADNAAPVASFNNSTVMQPLLNAINGGKGIFISFGGGYIGECLGLGDTTSGDWDPGYPDAGYFMQALDSHPIYKGLATWNPATLPIRQEQLLYRVNPGPKTGRGITLTGTGVRNYQITRLVDAGGSRYVSTGDYWAEKKVGQGVAVFIGENGFTLGTFGQAGITMYANTLKYVCGVENPSAARLRVESVYCESYRDLSSPVIAFADTGSAAIHFVVFNPSATPVSAAIEVCAEDVTGCDAASVKQVEQRTYQHEFAAGSSNCSVKLTSILNKSWFQSVSFGGMQFDGRKVKFTVALDQGLGENVPECGTTSTDGSGLGHIMTTVEGWWEKFLALIGSTKRTDAVAAAKLNSKSALVLFDKWGVPDWAWKIRDVHFSGDNRHPTEFWRDGQRSNGKVITNCHRLSDAGFNTILLGEYYEPDPEGVKVNDDWMGLVKLLAVLGRRDPGGFTFPAVDYSTPPLDPTDVCQANGLKITALRNASTLMIQTTIANMKTAGINRVLAYATPADLPQSALHRNGIDGVGYNQGNALACDGQAVPLRLPETSNLKTYFDCFWYGYCNKTLPMADKCVEAEPALAFDGMTIAAPLALAGLQALLADSDNKLWSDMKKSEIECGLSMATVGRPMYLSERAGYVPKFDADYNSKVAKDLKSTCDRFEFDGYLLDDMGRYREAVDDETQVLLDKLLTPSVIKAYFDYAVVSIAMPRLTTVTFQNVMAKLMNACKNASGGTLESEFSHFRLTKEDTDSPLFPTSASCTPGVEWYRISDMARAVRDAVKENNRSDRIVVCSDYFTHRDWASQPLSEDVYASDKAPIYSVHWAQLALAAKESGLKPVRTDLMHAEFLKPFTLTNQQDKLYEIAMGLAWSQGAYVQFDTGEVYSQIETFRNFNTFKGDHEQFFAPGQEGRSSTPEMIWHPMRPELGEPPFNVTASDGRDLKLEYGLGNVVPVAYKQTIEPVKPDKSTMADFEGWERYLLFLTNTYDQNRSVRIAFKPPVGKIAKVNLFNLAGSTMDQKAYSNDDPITVEIKSFCVIEYLVKLSDHIVSTQIEPAN